jgi:hypothetical protein
MDISVRKSGQGAPRGAWNEAFAALCASSVINATIGFGFAVKRIRSEKMPPTLRSLYREELR